MSIGEGVMEHVGEGSQEKVVLGAADRFELGRDREELWKGKLVRKCGYLQRQSELVATITALENDTDRKRIIDELIKALEEEIGWAPKFTKIERWMEAVFENEMKKRPYRVATEAMRYFHIEQSKLRSLRKLARKVKRRVVMRKVREQGQSEEVTTLHLSIEDGLPAIGRFSS
jgi:hypothetical protein